MEEVGERNGKDKIGANTVSSCMNAQISFKKKRKIRKFKMKVRSKSEN